MINNILSLLKLNQMEDKKLIPEFRYTFIKKRLYASFFILYSNFILPQSYIL